MVVQFRRSRRSGLVLSACVAVLLTSLGAASGASAGEEDASSSGDSAGAEPSDSSSPSPAEQMARRWGVRTDQAEARIALDPAAQRFTDDLARGLPGVFAGTWWDPGASKTLNVGVTHGSAGRVNAFLQGLPE